MHLYARGGQSLIELLIGIAIGAIFVIGAATAIVPSLRVGTQAGTVQAEAQLGQELLGNVKAWANGNWDSVLAIATGTANKYYLNTATSPFTAVGTSTSGEAITMSYAYSRAITVGSNASGTQTNFPMLVSSTLPSWASVAHGGHVQNIVTAPNGGTEAADLVFATSSANCGVSNLNFETESYSSSTGALVDWVNVPSLSAGSVIYACYGNSSVTTDQSHPSSTWNSNYKGVWHFPNGTALNTNDSTSNANNGTNNGATATTGQIDGGMATVASSLQGVTTPNINLGTVFTVEAWVNHNSTAVTGYERIMENGYGTGFYLGTNSAASSYTFIVSGNFSLTGGVRTNGQWSQLIGVYDGTNAYLYQDGVLVGGPIAMNNPFIGSHVIGIGYSENSASPSEFWDGSIDESRVSSAAESASWILTEYNNQNSPSTFYSLGSEQANSTSGGGGGAITTNITYDRYFYISDVYRDASGNVTSTATGNYYDPSTKLATVAVSAASSTAQPLTYSEYITRSGNNALSQTSWSGGSGQNGPVTFISNAYSTATSTNVTGSGAIQLYSNVSSGSSYVVNSVTTIGAGSWTVPAGVTSVKVELWGGGGGGGGGWGAGAGAYVVENNLSVTPGSSITYNVAGGGQGAGQSGAGGTGYQPGGNGTFGSSDYWGAGGGGSSDVVVGGITYIAAGGGGSGQGVYGMYRADLLQVQAAALVDMVAGIILEVLLVAECWYGGRKRRSYYVVWRCWRDRGNHANRNKWIRLIRRERRRFFRGCFRKR